MAKESNNNSSNQKLNEQQIKFLQDYMEVQKEEEKNTGRELEFRKQQLDKSHEYSLKALEAQQEFIKENRADKKSERKDLLNLVYFLLVIISVFTGICLFTNNIDFMKDVLGIIIPAIASGFGAYQYGFIKGKNQANQQDTE